MTTFPATCPVCGTHYLHFGAGSHKCPGPPRPKPINPYAPKEQIAT